MSLLCSLPQPSVVSSLFTPNTCLQNPVQKYNVFPSLNVVNKIPMHTEQMQLSIYFNIHIQYSGYTCVTTYFPDMPSSNQRLVKTVTLETLRNANHCHRVTERRKQISAFKTSLHVMPGADITQRDCSFFQV
jgi:hypothetical protein